MTGGFEVPQWRHAHSNDFASGLDSLETCEHVDESEIVPVKLAGTYTVVTRLSQRPDIPRTPGNHSSTVSTNAACAVETDEVLDEHQSVIVGSIYGMTQVRTVQCVETKCIDMQVHHPHLTGRPAFELLLLLDELLLLLLAAGRPFFILFSSSSTSPPSICRNLLSN